MTTLFFQKIFFIFALLITSTLNYAGEKILIAQFSEQQLSGWEEHSFKGNTLYSFTPRQNSFALKAVSQASASGLIKKIQIDLYKTPYLNWYWQVQQAPYRITEDFKNGDDFAARVYVVIDGGIFFWRTLALNYVWSSHKLIDDLWDNPFTANAKMLAVESGSNKFDQWIFEKRNVREDLKRAFNREIRFIDAVAIMTDTDNSGQSATAFYGDIFFSEN